MMFNSKISLKIILLTIFSVLLIIPVSTLGTTNSNEIVINPKIIVDIIPPDISDVGHFPDPPDNNDLILVNCTVTDAYGISFVGLYYREVGTSTFNFSSMLRVDSTDVYETEIGAYDEPGFEVEYYIRAHDMNTNVAFANNGGEYYSFTVISFDHDLPLISSITHTPNSPTEQDDVVFKCIATDMSGISKVELNYRVDGGSWITREMVETETSTYSYTSSSFDLGVLIEYQINATDDSYNNNSVVDNNDGEYYNFEIIKYDTTGPTISNITVEPAEPYNDILINITCTITDDYNHVDETKLIYRVNNGEWQTVDLVKITATIYKVQIGPFEKNDLVEFYVSATDTFNTPNEAIDDNNGNYYSFTVEKNTLTANFYIYIPIIALTAFHLLNKRRK